MAGLVRMAPVRYARVLLALAVLAGVKGTLESRHVDTAQGVRRLLTEAERVAVASVDGDPDFIVGVRGLDEPLCFRLEGRPGHVVRLLQDRESGVVVNARISRPVPGSRKTYLSAVLISRRNFRVVAKVGHVLVNRYRFAWGPVSVRLVHGHRVLIAPTLLALTLRNKNVTLVIKRHLPEGRRLANGTIISTGGSAHSAPSTSHNATTPGNHGNNVTATPARRRGNRRRDEDVDRGPRRRSRRLRRPGRRGVRTNSGDEDDQSQERPRTKRDTDFKNVDNDVTLSHKFDDADARHRTLTRSRRRANRDNDDDSGSATSPRPRSRSRSRSRSGTQAADAQGTSQSDGSDDDDSSGPRIPARELAAYMGFYVSDARDLSPQTHGLLGQFLYRNVTLEKVRIKPNGVKKARLRVHSPRPHHVKAKLRTRTNLALNASSACWWLRDGGRGVVDGAYTSYLVPRFRHTEFLPLPPGLIAE